jgi:pSer/pThr/pTyr-binding forkhead associated (FHA) protein
MPMKLTLSLGGRTLERYEFDKSPVRMGRNDDCDVPIDNLGISRYHTEIIEQEGFYLLRDLQSNNGTFVNGRRVKTHALNDGDEISIGKYSLLFTGAILKVNATSAPTAREDDLSGMTMQMDQKSLARVQREKASRVRGYLCVEREGRKENIFLDKSVFVIGKDKTADIQITGWRAPRILALVIRDESGFRLLNVSQKGKGISVNGKPARDVRLGDDDEILAWRLELRFLRGSPTH